MLINDIFANKQIVTRKKVEKKTADFFKIIGGSVHLLVWLLRMIENYGKVYRGACNTNDNEMTQKYQTFYEKYLVGKNSSDSLAKFWT